MVSTIICPRCKTKNSKKAEFCYNCKNPLKPGKTSNKKNPLSLNPKSRFDFRIIVTGLILFVLCNIVLLFISGDYAMLISGFALMLFLYVIFKRFMEIDDSVTLKSLGFKIILYYLVIVALGAILLLAFHLY
ncbi:zinc ribbon domain-containing protein [Methanobacterium formicicum]|uniref:Zinc-ribbon domain-containing protein n=1 Tax=Methanobacterium formicicum (strain DSM 3637 / PP1) TaxID=1204725 RepID=K2R3D9_METFP|nr:zinc ribbon domain-containing protein [Methanobacterium formicicum]EKF87068.1 hypothetical protein A994_02250 [Methanobacterium formicicum DSM 3637]